MKALIDEGRVRRGMLGVTVQPVTSDIAASLRLDHITGALVNDVQANGAADKAGLRRGDVVLTINGDAIDDSNALRNKVAQLGPGARATLTIVRQGRQLTLNATLPRRP